MTAILERPLGGTAKVDRPKSAHSDVRARKFRPDIEGMRAFAVVAVVLYHAHLGGVAGGYVGVDVFFVISGFLITRQLTAAVGANGIRALPKFYTARIKRLLPAGAVVVVATVVVARFYAPALQVRSIAQDGLFTTFYGLNYRLAIEGTQYLHQDDTASPLLHFWSLGVEEQFYVFWPVMILLIAWIGRRYSAALLSVSLVAVIGVSYYYSVTVTATSAPWAYFSLHTRAWELAVGALVAVGADRLARLPRVVTTPVGLLGLGLVITSAFTFSDATAYPGSLAAVPVLAAAAVLIAGCGQPSGVERILREPLLQSIGRVSYSWYLWHWPMLILIPMIVGHPLSWTARLGVVWLSLTFAVLSYFIVENPARHTAPRTWQGFSMGLAISGSVVATAVLVISHLPSLTGSGAAVKVVQASVSTPAVVKKMQAAVASGVNVVQAPSNLTPTPAKAAHDLPAADGTSCHASFTTITQGVCAYGDLTSKNVAVLVGDSHADMWLPAFTQAGLTKHWKIIDWTKSSCPVAKITVFNSSLNRTYTECDTWRAYVLKRIAALNPQRIFMTGSENVVNGDVSPTQWSTATISTLDTLRSTTKAKITFMQDVPVPSYSMPSCVAQHLGSVTACTFSTSKAYSFPARHRELASAVKKAGFTVVDPLSWICTTARCPAIVGNMLVYRDDTHLTTSFSRWLAPMLDPLLAPARKGK